MWSCGFFLVLAVVLSFGTTIKASDKPDRSLVCYHPELLLPFLDIDRYNKSYPFVDYKSVLDPVLGNMLQTGRSVTDCQHDLFATWVEACVAKDPEEAIGVLKLLAQDITHVLHTDESVYKISQRLFGDKMVAWAMNPPMHFLETMAPDKDCVHPKLDIFEKHCGKMTDCGCLKHLKTFQVICSLGLVQDTEFASIVEETCKDYTYTPNPLWNQS